MKQLLPRPVKDKIKELAYPTLYPRRFHGYCVGMFKTGTTSVAGMFERSYRAEHEAEKDRLIQALMRHESAATASALRAYLRRRDRRLSLEMESSAFCGFVIEALVELFPKSKYLVTVRTCESWLDSSINHLLARSLSPLEQAFLRWWLKPEKFAHTSGDSVLQQNNLFPLDAFLNAYATHYRRVLDAVPAERLLIVRTSELTPSTGRIAEFLGIPANTLNVDQSHLYRAKAKYGLVGQIDPAYLAERVAYHCGDILPRLGLSVPSAPAAP